MDLNGFVRKQLNARRVSLASKEEAIRITRMEYGSINVIGLPEGWPILIDSTLANKSLVVMGSGLVESKVAISEGILRSLPGVVILDKLGVFT